MADHNSSTVRGGFSRQSLEFGKHLLNLVEVGAVGRQVTQLRARRFDRGLHTGDLVAGQVVHHHDVARAQFGHEHLLHPSPKRLSIDGAIKHQRRDQPCAAQGGYEGGRLPMPAGCFAQTAHALGRAPARGAHGRCGPSLIEKHQALGIQAGLLSRPALACLSYVGTLLLAGVECLFLSISPKRASVFHIALIPIRMPRSLCAHSHRALDTPNEITPRSRLCGEQ